MSAVFQFYTVNFYITGFGRRQLSTVNTSELRTQLVNYIESQGGVPEGQWYRFENDTGFRAVITQTRALGGVVYDLPVRTAA